MAQQTSPGWYPDPSGSGQQRYWDGNQWTQHLAPQQPPAAGQHPPQQQHAPAQQPGGQQRPAGQYPPQQQHAPAQQPGGQQQPAGQRSVFDNFELDVSGGHNASHIQQQAQQAGVSGGGRGGGTIFTEPVLVVNQKTKLIEINNEYSVFGQDGQQLAAVVQVGQSALKKAVRFLGKYDQFMTHKLEVRDGHGQVLLQVTRPAKFMKSRVIVERGDGTPVGEIKQLNAIGKINFSMQVNGQEYGQIRGENWRAWNFAIVDHTGAEVARITKTFEGVLKTMFTTADNYVLQIHRPLQDPLLSLVVASALTVDTALKQDDRGWT
jgi:uncharacterized protein YxjI